MILWRSRVKVREIFVWSFESAKKNAVSCLFITLSEFLWSVTPFSLGTQSSFRRLYEEPIVRGQQPDASSEEKLLGQTRAAEVINSDEKLISSYWIDS